MGTRSTLIIIFRRQSSPCQKNGLVALRTNSGFPDRYETICTADIIYIPALFVPKIVGVISFIVNTADLYDEVALPVIIAIATHPSERVMISNGYLWGWNKTLHMKEVTAQTAHFVHPIKLSRGEDSNLWKKLMKTQLIKASQSPLVYR